MGKQIYGVLIDTVSIQAFIFASNRLKENLGASYLVQKIYQDLLKESVDETFDEKNISKQLFEGWKQKPNEFKIDTSPFEVGFIGGGKAFLLFREKEKAEEFFRRFSRKLLTKAPGISVNCATERIDLENFESSFKELNRKLITNKREYTPLNIPLGHGITSTCSNSGLPANTWDNNEKNYISYVSYLKKECAEEANQQLEHDNKDILQDKYSYTDELEKLGQSKDEDSHIAIVHIDGNGMGEKFQKITSLEEYRSFSNGVRETTKKAFKDLLVQIINDFDYIKNEINVSTDEQGKEILPIRPIIIGGDDITFVCDGRLGIYFAQVFQQKFSSYPFSVNNNISSCAGIAITRVKYPFYRGYKLAEELCQSAKDKRKEKKDEGSWLDFHLAYGGFSGSLDEIRKTHYKTKNGNLLLRPYKIDEGGKLEFTQLLEGTRKLKDLPNSFIKELREVLYKDEATQKQFTAHLRTRNYELPFCDDYNGKLFNNSKTPYYDMIEVCELYPEFALREGKEVVQI